MDTSLSPINADHGLAFNSSRPKSAASWGAILAGALVSIAVSLVLIALGSGLGFAAVSPWADHGVSGTTFSVAIAIWLIVMQWISASLGGYITGRLRTRWIGTHVHEIFFRDTANGFVTWALASVVVAALVASTVASGVGGGAKAASGVMAAGAQGAMQAGVASSAAGGPNSPGLSYGVDKLFRATVPPVAGGMSAAGPTASGAMSSGSTSIGMSAVTSADARAEATRIMLNAFTSGSVPDADRSYLVSLVAARTGMSDAEAQKRVEDFIASASAAEEKVKADADAARKDAAEFSIYTALSMAIGAFIASVSAALGGRLRDQHV